METSYEPGGPHDEYQATFEGQGTGIGDHDADSERSDAHDVSPSLSPPPSPPRNFAPRGPAKVRQRFRDRIPSPLNLRVDISKFAKNMQLDEIQNAYTKTVTNTVDGNGTRKTLEQLQWIINSSQLLDTQPTINSFAPAPLPLELPKGDAGKDPYAKPWTTEGAVAAATLGLGVASLSRWFFVEGRLTISPKRFTVALAAVLLAAFTFRVYMRRQWLRYIHNQTIAQVELFIKKSNELDSIAGSAVSFITEVELIARGYRLSLPLPPVSRLENNGQSLKSIKIRRELVSQMVRVMQQYHATAGALEEFCNAELLGFHQRGKQCSPETVSAQLEAFKNAKAEDAQKTFELRKSYNTLQDLRRMFLLSLFCLEPTGAKDEYMKFTTALEGLRICNDRTQVAILQIQKVLLSEELFNGAKSPNTPLSPDREKWRHQVRRIGNLNNNIRALQAKMVLLAEESNQAINNEHGDISHLGSMFMTQYELIGQDLKMLMEAWEAGKSSVALAIDRNERKRVSSASIMSPATSMSELASVSEESEGPDEALRRLTGEASPPTEPSSPTFPDEPVSFEAIAEPRPKSMMTREERIKKMHEDRESKIAAREKAMESGWLLGELKNVLQNREENVKSKRKSLGAAATPSGMRTLSLSSALP